jgi:CHAT domain-containing protein/Tfp pilus assembly protein PilF
MYASPLTSALTLNPHRHRLHSANEGLSFTGTALKRGGIAVKRHIIRKARSRGMIRHPSPRRFAILISLFILSASQEVRRFEAGRTISDKLKGGEAHLYAIALTSNQLLDLVVEQRGIDVEVRLFAPDGKQLVEMDSPNGKNGPEPLLAITSVDGIYRLVIRSLENNAAAGQYEVKMTEPRTATERDRARAEAFKLFSQSMGLRNQKKYEDAVPLAERALELREQTPDAGNPALSNVINHLAWLYLRLAKDHLQRGEAFKAEPLFRRLLDLRERTSGTEDPDVITALNYLATIYHQRGEYMRARPPYLRALELLENKFGKEAAEVATVLHNLAALAREIGDYAQAESWANRALQIRKEKFGDDSKESAESYNELGAIYHFKGDYARAEALYRQALMIWQRLEADHPNVATALHNLASCYREQRDYTQAEELYLKAVKLRERKPEREHRDLAESLSGLAAVYHDQRQLTRAEPLYRRALEINEQTLGADHPAVAVSLNNLGVLEYDQADYAKAEDLYGRALQISERAFGSSHPDVALWLYNLAILYRAKGDASKAIAHLARVCEIRESELSRNLLTGSERQKLAYLALFAVETNETLSLHLQAAPNDPQAIELAATTLLRRKGRALDAMTDTLDRVRRHASTPVQAQLDRLSNVRAQLAALIFRGREAADLADYRSQLKRLEDEADSLEAEVSANNLEFRAQTQRVTLDAIQSAIPQDAVLVEFALYSPRVAGMKRDSNPRYAAYVFAAKGQPRSVDLGEAAEIDLAVAELRQALRDPLRSDVKRYARAAYGKVVQPLRGLLGQARHVLIAPDGLLNLIPFAALVDEQGRYLVARYSFVYLTSGRDLLRLQVQQSAKGNPMIIADPAYGEPRNSQPEIQSRSIAPFARLRQSAREAQAIKAILPEATLLTGEQATETAVKRVSGPSILHIATHGFFLPAIGGETGPAGAPPPGGTVAADRSFLQAPASRIKNLWLRSGLALAGANARRSDEDDGLLTALEVAGLDLWRTRLVALSACDTGVGEVKNGEGVYGLRRALVLAGSESQVMSLWPVSDAATREWMVSYYKALQAGQGRGDAAREVQLQMLKQPRRQHPFYWASFIQSGAWTKLNGRR